MKSSEGLSEDPKELLIGIVGIIVDVRGWLCTGFEKFSTWKWAGRQFICSASRKLSTADSQITSTNVSS